MKSHILSWSVLLILLISRIVVSQSTTTVASRSGDAFEPGKVLAIVGGEPIFVGDMLFEVNQFIEKNAPHAPQSQKERIRPEVIKRMLPNFIEQRLLLISVKDDLPPEVDFNEIVENASKEFDKQALEGMMESAGVNSPAEFDAQLRAQGSSLRKLRFIWTQSQFVRAMLMEKIQADADVSHRELLDYYREHIDEYKTAPKAKWEQIMVRFDKFPSRTAARKAIVELGDKVVFGASFAATAEKHSHGFRAHEGGLHDWTSKDSLVLKEIDEAIFTLPPGRLSDIIETKRGYHIVRVIERQSESVTSFLDAQVEIKKKIEAERRVAAYDAHIATLKEKIPVEVLTESTKRVATDSPPSDDRVMR